MSSADRTVFWLVGFLVACGLIVCGAVLYSHYQPTTSTRVAATAAPSRSVEERKRLYYALRELDFKSDLDDARLEIFDPNSKVLDEYRAAFRTNHDLSEDEFSSIYWEGADKEWPEPDFPHDELRELLTAQIKRTHWAERDPSYTRGIGWSAARIKNAWGKKEGWNWYHDEPALSGEPGVVDLRARRHDDRARLQVIGRPEDVRSFSVMSSIELDGLEDDTDVKVAQWSTDMATPVALIGGFEPATVSQWCRRAFGAYLENVESDPFGGDQSIQLGEFDISISFFLVSNPAGVTGSLGIYRRDDKPDNGDGETGFGAVWREWNGTRLPSID